MIEFFREMFSEGSKISSKRVFAGAMLIVLIFVIFKWPDKLELINSIMFFIAGLVGFTVAGKHKALK